MSPVLILALMSSIAIAVQPAPRSFLENMAHGPDPSVAKPNSGHLMFDFSGSYTIDTPDMTRRIPCRDVLSQIGPNSCGNNDVNGVATSFSCEDARAHIKKQCWISIPTTEEMKNESATLHKIINEAFQNAYKDVFQDPMFRKKLKQVCQEVIAEQAGPKR